MLFTFKVAVRFEFFKSVENNYLNGNVTPRIFLNFQNKNTSASEYIFIVTNFSLLYRYTHGAWKRKMYSLALIYIQGCKRWGGVKCQWKCELMRGRNYEFCFIYHWCGMYVQCKLFNMKLQTTHKISCNFRENPPLNSFKKLIYRGPVSKEVEPRLLLYYAYNII